MLILKRKVIIVRKHFKGMQATPTELEIAPRRFRDTS